MPEARRVLVTGGAGFIGANLVRRLLAREVEVTVLDSRVGGRSEYLDGLEISFVDADVRDRDAVRHLAHGQDAVVHLAAQTGVPGSLEDPFRDCEVNVVGTLNVLEGCRESGARMIFASSNAPLGRQSPPASETKAPLPVSPYGASKLAGEGYCLAYHGSWEVETVVFRFANVYGPFSAHKESVVAKLFKSVIDGEEIVVDGDGRQTRDFVHVDDLCEALLRGLEFDHAGEIFQIATGVETSIIDLVELVRQATGTLAEARHGPRRHGDVRKNFSDISKAERLLEWRPTIDLKSGLTTTWEWFSRPA